MAFLISLAALFVAHAAVVIVLMRKARGALDRALVGIAVLAMFAAISLTVVRIFIVPREAWNDARLAQTTEMLKGYPLYVRPGSGAIGCFLYGPFGAIAYISAALASHSPTIDMLLGSTIAVICFFAPAAWLMRCLAPRTSILAQIVAFTCFAAIVHNSGTLAFTSNWIHVDPPALGLSACALAMVIHRDAASMRFRIGAALCAAMAIWTKQTLLPLLFALPLVVFLLRGWRQAIVDGLMMLGFVILFGVIFAMIFDPRAMLFEMVTEPSRHPRGPLLDVLQKLVIETWPLVLLLAVALVIRGRQRQETSGPWLARNLWCAPVILAAILIPGGILGWMKMGGEPNNAALSTYFLLIAGCATVAECEIPGLLGNRPDAAKIGRLICVLFAAEMSIHATFTDHMLGWRIGLALHPFDNGSELAYRFERAHPGEAYFPWNPNAVLLASGNLYHFDYAAFDREIANFRPSDEEVRAHLPPNMRYIAYPPHIVPSMSMMELIPGYDRRIELPELPGLTIYTRKENE
jgi:hypothetical protein